MPIRFLCDHCGGVLSIARRKAYALIDCPKCGCKQVVPSESRISQEEELRLTKNKSAEASSTVAVMEAPPVVKSAVDAPPVIKPITVKERPLFERDDIENLLAGDPKKIAVTPPSLKSTPSTAEIAAGVELLAEGGEVLLRKNQWVMVVVVAVLFFLFAFGLGFLAGKFS